MMEQSQRYQYNFIRKPDSKLHVVYVNVDIFYQGKTSTLPLRSKIAHSHERSEKQRGADQNLWCSSDAV